MLQKSIQDMSVLFHCSTYNLTTPSAPADPAISSSPHATANTPSSPRCRCGGKASWRQVLSAKSQKRTDESWAPERSVVPSGEIAREEILSRCAAHEPIQSPKINLIRERHTCSGVEYAYISILVASDDKCFSRMFD
jgi:hypothetical protein